MIKLGNTGLVLRFPRKGDLTIGRIALAVLGLALILNAVFGGF